MIAMVTSSWTPTSRTRCTGVGSKSRGPRRVRADCGDHYGCRAPTDRRRRLSTSVEAATALVLHRGKDMFEDRERGLIVKHEFDALEGGRSAEMLTHFGEHEFGASGDRKSRYACADRGKGDRAKAVFVSAE